MVARKRIVYYFYILRCADDTLYCGSTRDLQNRESRHNTGRGSKYVRAHGGGTIVYSEKFNTIGDALRREVEVKKWSRLKKLSLLNAKSKSTKK